MIDAERPVDRREQLAGSDFALGNAVARRVGLAVDRTALDAAP